MYPLLNGHMVMWSLRFKDKSLRTEVIIGRDYRGLYDRAKAPESEI